MFGKSKKQPVPPKPIRFIGGPWDGAEVQTGSGRPPYEITVCTRHYGDWAWRHSYWVLKQDGYWLAGYAGLYRRPSPLKKEIRPIP